MQNKFTLLIKNKLSTKPFLIFIVLFVATFITCTMAGVQWVMKSPYEISNWQYGITYAILIMTFLSFHEFGHYFASKYHKVQASLPYYIPFPFTFTLNFGTMGAVIRTRTMIPSRKALFDIGIAGPIAGFVVSLSFLIYGLITLPGIEYVYQIHPEYLLNNYGNIPNTGVHFGNSLLFMILRDFFANPNGFMPPMNEIYHYPFLNVGWFGLFVTTLNMLPIGQLDGGHVVFAMFGRKHSLIARIMWWFMVIIGTGAILGVIYEFLKLEYSYSIINYIKDIFLPFFNWINLKFPFVMSGWLGWLAWAIITKLFIKLDHPPVYDNSKLGFGRMILGYLSILLLLIMCFNVTGVYIVE